MAGVRPATSMGWLSRNTSSVTRQGGGGRRQAGSLYPAGDRQQPLRGSQGLRLRTQGRSRNLGAVQIGDALQAEIPVGHLKPAVQRVGERLFPSAMTVAAVDRLVDHSTIIQFDSVSYRRKRARPDGGPGSS